MLFGVKFSLQPLAALAFVQVVDIQVGTGVYAFVPLGLKHSTCYTGVKGRKCASLLNALKVVKYKRLYLRMILNENLRNTEIEIRFFKFTESSEKSKIEHIIVT